MNVGTSGVDKIVALCQKARWPVDERMGTTILLHFDCPMCKTRKLLITGSNTGEVGLFTTYSLLNLSGKKVPPEIPYLLLMRNGQMHAGGWQITADDDGSPQISLTYCAFLNGLSASMFT